jgi:hypothetical protein
MSFRTFRVGKSQMGPRSSRATRHHERGPRHEAPSVRKNRAAALRFSPLAPCSTVKGSSRSSRPLVCGRCRKDFRRESAQSAGAPPLFGLGTSTRASTWCQSCDSLDARRGVCAAAVTGEGSGHGFVNVGEGDSTGVGRLSFLGEDEKPQEEIRARKGT